MEFKSLTNIETSFRQLRTYAFVFAGICAVVTVTAVWMSYSFAERQRYEKLTPRLMMGILMIITAVTLIIIGKSLIKKMGMLLQMNKK